MFDNGKRTVSDERAVTLKIPAVFVPRETVNNITAVVFLGMLLLYKPEMVGPELGT